MTVSESQSHVSLLQIAAAQWLAKLSVRIPYNRPLALKVILAVPLLPLAVAVLCFCVNQITPGIVFLVLFLVIASYALHVASTHSAYPLLPEATRGRRLSASQIRAKSTPLYDVYTPPGPKQNVPCALLLVPGARIRPESYSVIARLLSDEGILVIVQNTARSSYYLPSTLTGSGPEELQQIMREVEKEYEIQEWAIGGHDSGTIPAALCAQRLGVSKLVLWGPSTNQWRVNLSKSQVIVLVVLVGDTTDRIDKNIESRLPPMATTSSSSKGGVTIYSVIKGGNRSGFAHYKCEHAHGEETLPLQEQQRQCVSVTSLFLKRSQSYYTDQNCDYNLIESS